MILAVQIRETDSLSMATTLLNCFAPFWKGFYTKGTKTLLQLRTDPFLSKEIPFQKGTGVKEANSNIYYDILHLIDILFYTIVRLPASVAQLDARLTGDQEVAGSTPAEVGNILSWKLIMKYFLRSFSPFR